MTKISKLIEQNYNLCDLLTHQKLAIELLVIQYSEEYAKQVLELAAKSATTTKGNECRIDENGDLCEIETIIINPFSITCITLPNHDEI